MPVAFPTTARVLSRRTLVIVLTGQQQARQESHDPTG